MNILIGAGAVTTVLAGFLERGGETANFAVRSGRESYYTEATLQVSGNQTFSLPAPTVSSTPDYTHAKRVFIGCKHQHLADVIATLKQQGLPAQVPLLPCLNGVAHFQQLRDAFPNNPLIPVTIMFNAQLPAPMQPVLTTSPLVYIDGDDMELMGTLRSGGMLVKQGSEATAWGKLILNLNNAIGALTESTFKDLLLSKPHRQAALATFDEATAVLTRAGIAFDVPTPVSWRVQRLILRYLPSLAWRIAKKRNQLSDQSFPSMLADIKASNTTEVNQLNGEIVRQAERLGIDAPVNRKLQQLVIHQQQHGGYLKIQQLNSQLGIK